MNALVYVDIKEKIMQHEMTNENIYVYFYMKKNMANFEVFC